MSLLLIADIAQIKTNEDAMPFVHSALNGENENCVSGRMLASCSAAIRPIRSLNF